MDSHGHLFPFDLCVCTLDVDDTSIEPGECPWFMYVYNQLLDIVNAAENSRASLTFRQLYL